MIVGVVGWLTTDTDGTVPCGCTPEFRVSFPVSLARTFANSFALFACPPQTINYSLVRIFQARLGNRSAGFGFRFSLSLSPPPLSLLSPVFFSLRFSLRSLSTDPGPQPPLPDSTGDPPSKYPPSWQMVGLTLDSFCLHSRGRQFTLDCTPQTLHFHGINMSNCSFCQK